MSTQLKFRGWNDYGYMTACVTLDDIANGFDGLKTCEVMQFTGLQDNNGKDIYEGDIVTDHNGKGVVKYSCKHAAFRVSYGDGTAKWFYDYILNGERESIEVIGSIHENPELF